LIASSDHGGLIARVMLRNRTRHRAGTGGTGAGRQPAVAAGNAAPALPPPSDEAASVCEIVEALRSACLARVIVVSTGASRQPGGVSLVRGLAAAGTASVLIDLTPWGRIAEIAGLEREERGLASIVAGTAPVAEIIHRDRHSTAHVVPSGGYRMIAAGQGLPAHLRLVLAAFKQAYGCSVIELDRAGIADLPSLMDDETAVVLGVGAGDDSIGERIGTELRSVGLADVVTMRIPADPRADPIATAAGPQSVDGCR
jgi:Mrp family chromosome partitioning ATPase